MEKTVTDAAIRQQYDHMGYDSGLHVVSCQDPASGAFLDFYDIWYAAQGTYSSGGPYRVYQSMGADGDLDVGLVLHWEPSEVASLLVASDAECYFA